MSLAFVPPFHPCMTDEHAGLSRDGFALGWSHAVAGAGSRPWGHANAHERKSYLTGYGAGREELMNARKRHVRRAFDAIRRFQAALGEAAEGGLPSPSIAELLEELPTLDDTLEMLAWGPTVEQRWALRAYGKSLTLAAQRTNPTDWL